MLMTGVEHHLAGYGNMGELVLPEQKGLPGYEGHLNKRVVTVASLLKDAGYHTYMVGKWHLGEEEHEPYHKGFEETAVVLQGLAGHFKAAAYYEGAETHYTRNGVAVDPPDGIYSVVNDTNNMLKFIDTHHADGRPFFGFWSVRMAHDPLQAPQESIDKFKGVYDAGYEELRDQRIQRLKKLGMMPVDTTSAQHGEKLVPPWNSLTSEEKAIAVRNMEIYAAMILETDQQVARIVDHLKKIGEYDNTLIFLLSDNGPNGETPSQFYGDQWVKDNFNNSLENLGKWDSATLYGPGWAQASAGPLRLHKGFTGEGGIRTPLIVSGAGVKVSGTVNTDLAYITDIVPTVLDAAGVKYPTSYNGEAIHPLSGKSMMSALSGDAAPIRDKEEALGWELFDRGALRKGDWKILWNEPPFGSGKWELFNLRSDLGETKDVSAENPEKFAEMMAEWRKYLASHGVKRSNKREKLGD
jgi:arylsulfatase